VELFSFPHPPERPSYPEACGLRHLALRVADMEASVGALVAHGVAVEPVRVDPFTGALFTFFADPDGLPIELVGPA
jgi:glyoxylase I family protein